jgi:hypothetical protein
MSKEMRKAGVGELPEPLVLAEGVLDEAGASKRAKTLSEFESIRLETVKVFALDEVLLPTEDQADELYM